VANVLVTISDEQGTILEQGMAKCFNNAEWEYRATTNGNVLVEAFDLAGNIARWKL
jgi:hypothetical protein